MSCAFLGQGVFPTRTINLAALGTTFNVFTYNAVWAEHRGRALSIKAKHRELGTGIMVPRPSIEPITFLRRVDTLHVLP